MNVRRQPLFADCGMGKTYMVLVSTEMQIKTGVVARGKTLVVGKLLTLEDGCLGDCKKFTDLTATILW